MLRTCCWGRAGSGLTSLSLRGLDFYLTDEGAAALSAPNPATGAARLRRLRALDLGSCVKLSGRGLGALPPDLETLRLAGCGNLKVLGRAKPRGSGQHLLGCLRPAH